MSLAFNLVKEALRLFKNHFAAYIAIIASFFLVILLPFLLFLFCMQFFDLSLPTCMNHTVNLLSWENQIILTTPEAIAVNLIMLFFLLLCMTVFLGVFLFLEHLDKTDHVRPALIFSPLINKKWTVIKFSILFILFMFLMMLIFHYAIFNISYSETYHSIIAALSIGFLYLMTLTLSLTAAVVALRRSSVISAWCLSFVSIIKHPLTWIVIAFIFSVFYILILYSGLWFLSFLINPVFLALIYAYHKRILQYEKNSV